MLWKRIVLLQRSRLRPFSTAKSNGSRRELASLYDGECLEKNGHIEANGFRKSLRSSVFTGREALHASWLSVACPKLPSQQHNLAQHRTRAGANSSFQLMGASHWKMQTPATRMYHGSGSVLQRPDVLVPPPEKKGMQETGDRNVDIFDRDLKTKHVRCMLFSRHSPRFIAPISVPEYMHRVVC